MSVKFYSDQIKVTWLQVIFYMGIILPMTTETMGAKNIIILRKASQHLEIIHTLTLWVSNFS